MSLWDNLEKERELLLEEVEERNNAKEDHKDLAIMEEVSWRQKSRELVLKEGDGNTWFFHRMTSSHKRRNSIKKIISNGWWLKEQSEIKNGVVRPANNFSMLLIVGVLSQSPCSSF